MKRRNFINTIYTHAVWVVLVSLLVAYFSFRVLQPDLSLGEIVRDFYAWLHTVFVMVSNVVMVSAAYDTATQRGTESDEFEKGDELNNYLIKEYNKNPERFRTFVGRLNEHERETMRQEFLFSKGVKSYDELDEKARLEWDKLRPIYHDILGFNLPLYYEATNSGVVSYKASERKNEGKYKQMILKGITGLIFSLMTVNVALNFKDVGGAFISLLIIVANLLVTFLLIFAPRLHKFKNELPKKVLHKNALWQSFIEKDGELKKAAELKTSDLTHEITQDEQIPNEHQETPTNA